MSSTALETHARSEGSNAGQENYSYRTVKAKIYQSLRWTVGRQLVNSAPLSPLRPGGQASRECVDPPLAWPTIAQEINQSEERWPQFLSSFFFSHVKNLRQRSLKALSPLRNPSTLWGFFSLLSRFSVGGGGYWCY